MEDGIRKFEAVPDSIVPHDLRGSADLAALDTMSKQPYRPNCREIRRNVNAGKYSQLLATCPGTAFSTVSKRQFGQSLGPTRNESRTV
jgi:hypothetical protein